MPWYRRFCLAVWENESGSGGAGNTARSLTHQLDTTERGLPHMLEEPEADRDTSRRRA